MIWKQKLWFIDWQALIVYEDGNMTLCNDVLIPVMARWPQHNTDVQNKRLWYCFAVIWSKPWCIHMNIWIEVFLLLTVKQFQPFYKICYTEIDHISSLLLSSLHCWRHSSQSTLCQKSECLKWLTGRGRLWLAIKSAGQSHNYISLLSDSRACL